MPDAFLSLSRDAQGEALGVAATQSGRPAHLFEKDVWVVWALDALFSSDFGEHLVFKGGTSLSKGYDIIKRFSEDVDVTYDVRELLPELARQNPIPRNNSQARKWGALIKLKLPAWIQEAIVPLLQAHATATAAAVTITAEGEKVYVAYSPDAKGDEYVARRVTLEFGARSTGEPTETKTIGCDAAPYLSELEFPIAHPRLMLPKRTFWEKATAVHVYCGTGEVGDRHSRHWHDLVRLDEAGYAQLAFEDRALANEVAEFKSRFFRDKDRNGKLIDYVAAVSGKLQLVPDADAKKVLAADYKKMADEGILLDDAEPFEELMKKCADLEARVNEANQE
jgi:hypothetical protein